MSFESELDREAFLDVDDFGVEAILDPDGQRIRVKGIFDSEKEIFDTGDHGLSTATLTFVGRTSDLAGASQTDYELEIEGVTYKVLDFYDDATGMTMLNLHKKST